MAAVSGQGGGQLFGWAERNNEQSGRLLQMFLAAKPAVPQIPWSPETGSDHPKPQGPFSPFLFGPGVWPPDSETALSNEATGLGQDAKFYEDKADEQSGYANQVFSSSWTAGAGAEAAEAAYRRTRSALLRQAAASETAGKFIARAAGDVGRTKRFMSQANDAAHAEIEAFLRAPGGKPTAQIAVILTKYRTQIMEHSAELHGHVAQDTQLFLNHFPLAPTGTDGNTNSGTNSDQSTDAAGTSGSDPKGLPGGTESKASSGETAGIPKTSGGPLSDQSTGGVPLAPLNPGSSRPVPSPLGSGGGLPMSGLPSVPSGGGSGAGVGSGLGPLSGLLGGPGLGGMSSPATAGLNSSAVQPLAPVSSLGADFGRGLAAGASAAGGAVTPAAPVPQAPATPLAAPVNTAPAAAVPAAAPVSAPAPAASGGVPTGGSASAPGAPAGGGLAPYGSVLPPAAPAAAPAAGAVPPPAPSVPSGGGGPGVPAAGAAGLVPVAQRDSAPVRRDLAMSDLELARAAVAEIAGPSCVDDAAMDWAVAVGRNNSSGMPTLWVATNDGATYIPPGVYLRKTMPIAAGFDEDFDVRWFGWVNPAEKAVRAARARGDAVSAVATTWGWQSEYLDETVPEVAIGVADAGTGSPASELTRSRSHRLQTVAPPLYDDLKQAGEPAAGDFCRELTRRVAFEGGEDLSPLAQGVARALVAHRWPTPEEWGALVREYDSARIMVGAQRPGLNGVEDLDQLVSYRNLFVKCRRLEALVCWQRSGAQLADVVYAAWVAGVRASLLEFAA